MCQQACEKKGTKDPSLSILHTFYKHRVPVALQHVQVVFILKCAIAKGEGSFRLSIFSRDPLLSSFDMLLVIGRGRGPRTCCSPCGLTSWVVLQSSWTWVLPFCSLYSPFFWVLWFIYNWHCFIIEGLVALCPNS